MKIKFDSVCMILLIASAVFMVIGFYGWSQTLSYYGGCQQTKSECDNLRLNHARLIDACDLTYKTKVVFGNSSGVIETNRFQIGNMTRGSVSDYVGDAYNLYCE